MTEGLATALLKECADRNLTLATAESCTGGMISAAITDIAGSSAVFDRGFVTYSYRAKTEMLGVPTEMLAEFGAVSEDVARAMAEGARERSGAALAIAVTGVAGPGSSEAKPEGMVCFAVASGRGTDVETMHFGAIGRAEVRLATTHHALNMALRHLHTNG